LVETSKLLEVLVEYEMPRGDRTAPSSAKLFRAEKDNRP